MTIVPTSIQEMIQFQEEHLGQIHYSETDSRRLNHGSLSDLLLPTDCSGNIARLHAFYAKLYIGTYTGDEQTHGTLVTMSRDAAAIGHGMLPGDCPLYNWSYMPAGRYNHINMYIGNGEVLNHGGPGNGPVRQSLRDNVAGARTVNVRRFVHWPTTPPPPPIKGHPDNPMHGHPIPALIARGTNDFYGLESDPRNESHGGYYESERPNVLLIEEFLRWWYPNPSKEEHLLVDGHFGSTTRKLVTLFQQRHKVGLANPGEVHFDTWLAMASV